jgi:hypothetical protein
MTALDRAALHAWIVSDDVVSRGGDVWSWRGTPDGYPYPEAAGLWLSWIANVDPEHPRATVVVTALERGLDAAIGRDGVGYTFDLGVVLSGIIRLSLARGTEPTDACVRAASRLASAIVEHRATTHGSALDRWSSRFGAHQRKLAVALACIDRAELLDTHAARAALRRAPVLDEGTVYVHAAAYALEGAWALGDHEVLARGAAWLAEIQQDDGGLRASWEASRGAHGPVRADATAQAIRLWCAHDRRRWASAIDRGLERLATLAVRDGGVRYGDDCDHRNVWCTLFALQAARFADDGAVLEALL